MGATPVPGPTRTTGTSSAGRWSVGGSSVYGTRVPDDQQASLHVLTFWQRHQPRRAQAHARNLEVGLVVDQGDKQLDLAWVRLGLAKVCTVS
jgi:hypothetical protein